MALDYLNPDEKETVNQIYDSAVNDSKVIARESSQWGTNYFVFLALMIFFLFSEMMLASFTFLVLQVISALRIRALRKEYKNMILKAVDDITDAVGKNTARRVVRDIPLICLHRRD